MNIEMSGSTKLQAKLRALALNMQATGTKNAVRAGGKVIQAAMVERAAVPRVENPRVAKQKGSNSLPKGAIGADIKTRVTGEGPEAVAVIGPGKKTGYAARFVEYGHRMVVGGQSKVLGNGRTRGPGKEKSVSVPAYPFLRPAFEASVEEAIDVRNEVLRQEIGKAVQ